jgi:phosphopantothenoylcysteine decarboxylase/phosphopantothenate--cysteine ligase
VANVVVCVGGSVAAYKACDLVSKLVQAGHRVDVVLTRMATRFIKPLAFSALTQRRAHTDRAWGEGTNPAEHLAVTRDAALVIVAPCTANLIGRFAHGLADEIVSTTVLGAGVRGDGPETDPLQCKLSRPHGLFAAPDGTLYVTDSEAHRIRVLKA